MAPHGVYPAKGEDVWLSIAVGDDAEWRALAEVMGQPGLAHDPRFAAAAERHANRAELDGLVARWTATVSAEDAASLLQAAGVPAHASWTTRELAHDPHLRTRGAIVTVQEPDGKERAAVGVPMRLSKGAEVGIDRGTPKLGEHEDYVYGELLGMSTAERQALQDEQVIY
jgi:crotonobetainyl-CoA:carnitine CoA-transferase CaiB-like acyl-CoA transferase